MELFPRVPLDAAQAEAFARGLLGVAGADGVHAREAALVASIYAGHLPEADRDGELTSESLCALPPLAPPDLAAALPDPEHRRMFVRAALALAWVDGVTTPQEHAAIEAFTTALGVSRDELSALDASVHAMHGQHPLASSLPAAVRAELPDLYCHYLRQRNGELSPDHTRLPKREEFFAGLRPVRWSGAIDAETFRRNHEGKLDRELSELMLFLLVVAKINRVERYGVDIADATGKSARGVADAYVIREEHCHTRILLSVLACFGIDIELQKPTAISRAMIHTIVRLPKSLTMPLVLCAELGGLVLFKLLLDRARRLLADQPAVLDRVVLLLREIITDELSHVAFARGQLGAVGIAAARSLLPAVVRGVFGDLPEVPRLFDPAQVAEEIARFDLRGLSALCVAPPFWMDAAPAG
jgi:hypothetical protein